MQDGSSRFGEGGGDDKQTRVLPAFFMSFERNDRKVEGTFLGSALRSALPNSIAIFLGCLAAFFAAPYFGLNHAQMDLVMYLTVGIVSLAGVIKASQPMNLLHGVSQRRFGAGLFRRCAAVWPDAPTAAYCGKRGYAAFADYNPKHFDCCAVKSARAGKETAVWQPMTALPKQQPAAHKDRPFGKRVRPVCHRLGVLWKNDGM